MPSAPRISIVIPVYNDEDSIGATLDSCLAQSLAEIEVICVDDASTDGTTEVIESYRARDSRIRLIRQGRNLSAFQARRAGILAAQADHVLFLDGDDRLTESAAQLVLAQASTSGADLVGFGVRIVRPDGRSGGSFESRLQPRHRSLQGRTCSPVSSRSVSPRRDSSGGTSSGRSCSGRRTPWSPRMSCSRGRTTCP